MSNHATTIATAVGLLNAGDVDGYITTLYAPEAVFHGFPPAFSPDRDGIAAFFRALRAGVPDANIAAEDLLADGDRVAFGSPSPEPTPGSCSEYPRPASTSKRRESPLPASPGTALSNAGTGSTTSRS